VTEWNLQGRFQGRTDVPLNDEGIAQARTAARRLQKAPVDIIVSSPLIRAVATAEAIAAEVCRPVDIDADMIECDFGSFEGRSIHEVMAEHGITTKASLAKILPPDAERWNSISERSLRCVSKWLNRHPQAVVLFVSHDAVMQSMAEALCHRWFDNRHGTPYSFVPARNAWTLVEVA
jgi:broad specificity phosphatase PhoE